MTPIRILKSAAIYPGYLRSFYAARPHLASQPYEVQHAALMADSFTWADVWKRELEGTQEFEVCEVIPNAEPLQRRWWHSRGHSSKSFDPIRVLWEQIGAFKPDVYFQHGFLYFTPRLRRQLRRDNPCIRIIVGYDGVARHDEQYFQGVDLILTCLPSTEAYYRSKGYRSAVLKLGFDAAIAARIGRPAAAHDVTFVGGLSFGGTAHTNRLRLLAEVQQRIALDLHLSMPSRIGFIRSRVGAFVRGNAGEAILDTPRMWRDYESVRRRNLGERFGLAMYDELASSRITLNVHIDAAGDKAVNMRMFEATGVGTCLLTDLKGNLGELFDIDSEVVTFASADECVAKARWLLNDNEARQRIAAAGQSRTLRDHSLGPEIRRIGSLLREML